MCIQEAVVTVGIGNYCIHRGIVIEGSWSTTVLDVEVLRR